MLSGNTAKVKSYFLEEREDSPFHQSLLRLHDQSVKEDRMIVEAVDKYNFTDFLVILATVSFLC